MTQQRPRQAALHDAWRAAGITAPAFTGPAGVPVARAVKCLLDPLILRPRRTPELARPTVDAAGEQLMRERFASSRPRLEAASQWYDLLRQQRRARGITDGNPQELYFPRAYELAAFGAPGEDALEQVAETLADVHGCGVGVDDLLARLQDAEVQAAAQQTFARAWNGDRDGDVEGAAEGDADLAAAAAAAAAILAVLDDDADRDDEAWRDLVTVHAAALGASLRHTAGALDDLARAARSEAPADALVSRPPLQPPPLTEEWSDAGALERSLAARVRAAARRLRAVGEGIDLEVITDEIDRACAPCGLHESAAAATLLAGFVASGWLRPLDPTAASGVPRHVQRMLRAARNAGYVLHLRRALTGGAAIHPAQQPVVAQLHAFAHPFQRRLWARLHGRDVLVEPIEGPAESIELLTGVTHSTLNDLRSRIRTALERTADEERGEHTALAQ